MADDDGAPLPRPAPTTATNAHRAPLLQHAGDLRWRVDGLFHRAVDPAHRASALAGSRSPGRYSRPDQPTLYLSSSPEGVAAAMVAHRAARGDLVVVTFEVHAEGIIDLRETAALHQAGVDPADAAAPWQDVVAAGGTPRSWGVRQRLEDLGAHGRSTPRAPAPGCGTWCSSPGTPPAPRT